MGAPRDAGWDWPRIIGDSQRSALRTAAVLRQSGRRRRWL